MHIYFLGWILSIRFMKFVIWAFQLINFKGKNDLSVRLYLDLDCN